MSKINDQLTNIRNTLQIDAKDVGNVALQIARLQYEVSHLSEHHFSKHRKDNHSRLGLQKKIQHMKSLEKYLVKKNPAQCKSLYVALGRKVKAVK